MPLWFGNQHLRRDEENPTYGTAMVVKALIELGEKKMAPLGIEWLLANQNADGGWGGGSSTPSSIEETALALETLASRPEVPADVLSRGAIWLIDATREGTHFPAAPIGFYFAKLWYYERLYPMVWTVGALEALARRGSA